MLANAYLKFLDISMPIIERNFNDSSLILSIIAFVVFCLIITIKLTNQNYLHNLIKSTLRFEDLQKTKQKSNSSALLNIATISIPILNISATIMMIITYFKIPVFNITNSFTLIFIIIFAVVFYLFLTKTNLILIGNLTNMITYATDCTLIRFNNLKVLSLFLLPVFLLFPFVNTKMQSYLVVAAILVLVIIFLIKIISFFIYLFKIKFLNHYSILYFCTLEILPLLIVCKLIGMW
ncbi:MAG TPA: DUF4271 domain-containing protein [Bacteroidales bacterium]|mgnify:CR=1 FL=1|nr:DUF4271 domain-containing protein [Bacteroidales bacterium]HPL04685.1 DUF4271 domain-containing protein [Bacteroidales bacterium]HPX76662.1 DUF4271 domain-containing protein [Bacteroidales bacterium]